MLVNGQWQGQWQPRDKRQSGGRFVRRPSTFRHWVTAEATAEFPAEAGRYHLYVAYICPWASRALIWRSLKGLEDIISVSVVNPCLTDQGWSFAPYPDSDADPLHQAEYLHQLYSHADSHYTGRATVPVLWDKQQQTMVNNESSDICRMLNQAFDHLTGNTLDLYPAELREEIDGMNDFLYSHINNGVYKTGFATSQAAYEDAVVKLFDALDHCETILTRQPYLLGQQMTESDWRLFVTLIRFDAVYYSLFKANLRQIRDYPQLSGFMQRLLEQPGIANTVNMQHIKAGYYSIRDLNPEGIIPLGPKPDLTS